jgi:hypothetical protein
MLFGISLCLIRPEGEYSTLELVDDVSMIHHNFGHTLCDLVISSLTVTYPHKSW